MFYLNIFNLEISYCTFKGKVTLPHQTVSIVFFSSSHFVLNHFKTIENKSANLRGPIWNKCFLFWIKKSLRMFFPVFLSSRCPEVTVSWNGSWGRGGGRGRRRSTSKTVNERSARSRRLAALRLQLPPPTIDSRTYSNVVYIFELYIYYLVKCTHSGALSPNYVAFFFCSVSWHLNLNTRLCTMFCASVRALVACDAHIFFLQAARSQFIFSLSILQMQVNIISEYYLLYFVICARL